MIGRSLLRHAANAKMANCSAPSASRHTVVKDGQQTRVSKAAQVIIAIARLLTEQPGRRLELPGADCDSGGAKVISPRSGDSGAGARGHVGQFEPAAPVWGLCSLAVCRSRCWLRRRPRRSGNANCRLIFRGISLVNAAHETDVHIADLRASIHRGSAVVMPVVEADARESVWLASHLSPRCRSSTSRSTRSPHAQSSSPSGRGAQ